MKAIPIFMYVTISCAIFFNILWNMYLKLKEVMITRIIEPLSYINVGSIDGN